MGGPDPAGDTGPEEARYEPAWSAVGRHRSAERPGNRRLLRRLRAHPGGRRLVQHRRRRPAAEAAARTRGNFSECYSDMDCIIDDQLWTPEELEGARGLFAWGPPPPPSF